MKHIKTRIHTDTDAALAAQKVGGVSVKSLKLALQGDTKVLKKLGAMSREGEMVKLLMPAIVSTIKTKIQNEKDWNSFLAEYIDEGSKASLEISAAENKANLANAKYVHGKKELHEQFQAAWRLEKGRHNNAINYNRARFFAEIVTQRVEGQVRQLEQQSRLELKQVDEDRKYQLQEAQHVLQYGNESNLELIHKRDYGSGANDPNLWRKFRNTFGI